MHAATRRKEEGDGKGESERERERLFRARKFIRARVRINMHISGKLITFQIAAGLLLFR